MEKGKQNEYMLELKKLYIKQITKTKLNTSKKRVGKLNNDK